MMFLKQSTVTTVKLGPFLDDSDGKTAEAGLTISQADVRLSKNGGDYAQKGDANACTHDELGEYNCQLSATDTGTLGRLKLIVAESGALPVWHEYMVVPANVWDSLFGADKLQVHAAEITAGLITSAAVAVGAIDADAIAASAITAAKIADGAIDAAAIADGAIDAGAIAASAITAEKIATDAITSDELATSALNEIADAILKRDWTGLTGEAARSVLNALRFLRNKFSISGSTLTVTKEDDTTSAWTATVTMDAAADPVTGVDPA